MISNNFDNLLNHQNVIINTGNVLTVNKKAGQKSIEELIDCVQATLKEPIYNNLNGEVHRSYDDLHDKINQHERNNIKIGAKLFLNTYSIDYITESINTLLKVLNVNHLDNLILSYHPLQQQQQQNSENNDDASNIEWNKKYVNELKLIWKTLEKFAENNTICQLGVADLDIDTLKSLYDDCKITPVIAQINLAACCVVPPALQEFCHAHDIQLLTHSDPEVMLTVNSLNELGIKNYEPKWTIRYQVHVKCRGLLTAKGFIIGIIQCET